MSVTYQASIISNRLPIIGALNGIKISTSALIIFTWLMILLMHIDKHRKANESLAVEQLKMKHIRAAAGAQQGASHLAESPFSHFTPVS